MLTLSLPPSSVQKTGSTDNVAKCLGTGDPEAEANWHELFRVLKESPELMYERDSRRKPAGGNASVAPRPAPGPSSSSKV